MQGDQTSAASLLRWFHDQLAPDVSYADLDREAKQIPPGSEGLRALVSDTNAPIYTVRCSSLWRMAVDRLSK